MSNPQILTVRQLIALYQRHCEANNVHSEAAREHRDYIFGLFCAAHGDKPITEMKPHVLTDFILGHTGWKSTATKKSAADAIRAVWSWAIDEERITSHPFRKIRYANAEPRPAFPDEEFHRLCDVSNKRYERIIRFLRLTGCRCSEACNLTWPDVDFARGVCTFQRHKSRRFTGRPKTIALVPEVVALLRQIQSVQPIGYDGTVFLNNKGTPWTRGTLGYQLRRMKERYGITTPASLHGLRHALAKSAVERGAPMKLVSLQLGHQSSAITEKYYANVGYAVENIRAAAALGQPTTPDA